MALVGSIRVPSDKSISHRAVLFASLAQGASSLTGVLPSADVIATIDAMRKLGAIIDLEQGEGGLAGTVTGINLHPTGVEPYEMYCANSGTTARLLLGVLSGLGVEAELTGDTSLSKRPMRRVMAPLEELGARFESDEDTLPVTVLPQGQLHGACLQTQQASAQVKSAILLAGMQAVGRTCVTEPFRSRDHTELLLPAFGVDVHVDGLTSCVDGPASLHAHDMSVPADPSSATFVAVAASCIASSDVLLEQVALNKTRTGAFEVLSRMGASLERLNESMEGREPVGDVRVAYSPHMRATVVSPAEIPTLIDEIPVLAIAAAIAEGETVFESAGELRVKESDRLAAIIDGLAAFGISAFAEGDDLHVVGIGGMEHAFPCSVELPTYGDHRLAMTWHLAGLVFGVDVMLDDRDCVRVSWPDFFDDIEGLSS